MLCTLVSTIVLYCFQNIEPEIPEYDSLNIRMRGYDFVILESFAKYVHNTAKLLDMDAVTWVSCWWFELRFTYYLYE